jgi:hypothetical protein
VRYKIYENIELVIGYNRLSGDQKDLVEKMAKAVTVNQLLAESLTNIEILPDGEDAFYPMFEFKGEHRFIDCIIEKNQFTVRGNGYVATDTFDNLSSAMEKVHDMLVSPCYGFLDNDHIVSIMQMEILSSAHIALDKLEDECFHEECKKAFVLGKIVDALFRFIDLGQSSEEMKEMIVNTVNLVADKYTCKKRRDKTLRRY